MKEQDIRKEPDLTISGMYTTEATAGYIAQGLYNQGIVATNDWHTEVLPRTAYIRDKNLASAGLVRTSYTDKKIVVPGSNLSLPPYMDHQYIAAIALMAQTANRQYDPHAMLESCVAIFPDYFLVNPHEDGVEIEIQNKASLFIELAECSNLAKDWSGELAIHILDVAQGVHRSTGKTQKAFNAAREFLYANLPPHIPRAAADAFIGKDISPTSLLALDVKTYNVSQALLEQDRILAPRFYSAEHVHAELNKPRPAAPIIKAETQVRPEIKKHEKSRIVYTDFDYTRSLFIALHQRFAHVQDPVIREELLNGIVQCGLLEFGIDREHILRLIPQIDHDNSEPSRPPVGEILRELIGNEIEVGKMDQLLSYISSMDEETLAQRYIQDELPPGLEQYIHLLEPLCRAKEVIEQR